MAKRILVKFFLTRSDVVKALQAFALRQPRNWILAVISGGVAVSLLGRWVTGGIVDQFTAWGIFAGLVFVVFVVWSLLANPWLEGRRFEKTDLLSLERIWVVDGGGLLIRVVSKGGKSAEERLSWDKIRRFYQTADYLLLLETGEKASVHILPMSAFESEKQRRGFVQFATRTK